MEDKQTLAFLETLLSGQSTDAVMRSAETANVEDTTETRPPLTLTARPDGTSARSVQRRRREFEIN